MTFQPVIAGEHCVPVWPSYCRTERRYVTCHCPSLFEIAAFMAGTKLESARLILYMSVMLFITLLIYLPFPISNFSCFHITLLYIVVYSVQNFLVTRNISMLCVQLHELPQIVLST
jgi:hypothetical protein